MAVLIKNSQKLLKIRTRLIKKATESLLSSLGFEDKDLSILFVDNKKITLLNQEYFGKNRPTNVISFSYMDGLPGEVLGDIIISVERAEEEALVSGTHFNGRLLALIVHGLTHIMGYDHEKDEGEKRRMKQKEKELMAFLADNDAYQALTAEEKEQGSTERRR